MHRIPPNTIQMMPIENVHKYFVQSVGLIETPFRHCKAITRTKDIGMQSVDLGGYLGKSRFVPTNLGEVCSALMTVVQEPEVITFPLQSQSNVNWCI